MRALESRRHLHVNDPAQARKQRRLARLMQVNATPTSDTLERVGHVDGRFLRFCDMFIDASASEKPEARREVLDYYNHQVGPMLQTEEAAMQLLVTRLAHLKLETGWHVRFHVVRSLTGKSVRHLARDYRIGDIFSHPKGGVGVMIEPADPHSTQASIMLFRGTASRASKDILANAIYPSGGLDDIHHMGVGHIGTQNLKSWFQAQVDRVQAQGRRVILVGHSLGGAYALKLLATLPEEKQAKVHTLTFCPPGITWREARAITSPAKNNRIIFHRWDPVSLAGVAFPPAMFATIYDNICRGPYNIPHGLPQLAIREARGDVVENSISQFTVKSRPTFNAWAVIAEPIRILGGRMIRGLLRD